MQDFRFPVISQNCPIHISAQIFADDYAVAFTLDIDAERFANARLLAVSEVVQVSVRGSTRLSKSLATVDGHREPEGFEFVHASILTVRLFKCNNRLGNLHNILGRF